MGRQINFYMDRVDEKEFLNRVFQLDSIKIMVGFRSENEWFPSLDNINKIESFDPEIKQKLFLMDTNISDDFNIKYAQEVNDYYVDLSTVAIQFNRCCIKNKLEIKEGRLFLDTNSWNYHGIDKVKIKQMTKWYSQLERWIKKRYKKIPNDFRYIGPHTLEQYKQGKLKLVGHGPAVFYRMDIGESGEIYNRKEDEVEDTKYIDKV